ncbi:type II toxin-antitoxin system VapB family antitoxin [Sphingomonas psychrolutea]|uniref:Antitoxin VapB n=1 Tax=Sphingomonas psychrolutea TaxID=1259676 RepID=A0ABQ1GDD5_9SPHN|nr:type II toxin-antitoxin system VapB family antitoxin [Sphingomonas psychrolutea]GGA41611.1 hypothetical protein GCM10011395_09870 [Sphingomonas psychrolutea]
MGVQLNIKDAETVQLARDLAKATGQSVTGVVKGALQRDFQHHLAARAEKIRRIDDIIGDFGRNLPPDWVGKTSKEIMDSIYNEDGSFA